MEIKITNLTTRTIVLDGYIVPAGVGASTTVDLTQSEFESFTALFAAVNAGEVSFSLPEVEKGTLIAASQDQIYNEPIPTGNNVTAHGIKMPSYIQRAKLHSLSAWSALPAGTGTVLIRIWRYRRLTASSPFSYTQITDPFTYDSSIPFSFEHNFSDHIRSGFDLVPNDQLAVGRVFTPGASNGLVNLLLKWSVEPLEGLTAEAPPPPDTDTWPPA